MIGVGGTLLLTYLNHRGVRGAAAFQGVLTYCLIVMSLVFIGAGIGGGAVANLQPLVRESAAGAIAWTGILGVFAAAPMWFSGFNVIPQVMEERSANTSLRLVGRVMLLTIAAAALFYVLVILSASMAVPWRQLVGMELPAVTAFRMAFRSPVLANVVLVAALLGIVTTWNTAFIAASRVLYAFGRAHLISPAFGAVHPVFGSPARAVLFVGVVGAVAAGLGRNALIPIVNVGSTCLAFGYLLTCIGLIRLRRRHPDLPRPYRTPLGGLVAVVASGGAAYMLGMTLYQPLADARWSFPLEWVFILGWTVLGAAFWVAARGRRAEVSEAERARLMLGGIGESR
jgi:amino acid transporter